MTSKNTFSIIGNLCSDPNLQASGTGTPVCNFRMALSRKFKNRAGEMEQATTFVDVAIWGTRGEAFGKFHRKGDLASVDGWLRTEEWQDKETGAPRSALKLVGTEWYFVGERKVASGTDQGPRETAF